MPILRTEAPADSLLCRQALPGDHLDAFRLDTPAEVRFEDFVAAFYTSWLFRLERRVLQWAGHPSSDRAVHALARGQAQALACWTLEAREEQQLLMRDLSGATCSWLGVQTLQGGSRLLFGSGVRARPRRAGRSPALHWPYRALMSLHLLYSRALLAAAARKLADRETSPR